MRSVFLLCALLSACRGEPSYEVWDEIVLVRDDMERRANEVGEARREWLRTSPVLEDRILAFHSLAESTEHDKDLTYAQWLTDAIREDDSALLIAALFLGGTERTPILIRAVWLRKLLDHEESPVVRRTLLSLRNRTLLPDCESETDAFRFVDALLELESLEERIHEVLEVFLSCRYVRGERLVALIPAPEAGPLKRTRSLLEWAAWWKKYREYLVWIPPRRCAGHSTAGSSHVWLQEYHCPRVLGGGFFLFDEDAFRAGVWTARYRADHPWLEDGGPNDPRWYRP